MPRLPSTTASSSSSSSLRVPLLFLAGIGTIVLQFDNDRLKQVRGLYTASSSPSAGWELSLSNVTNPLWDAAGYVLQDESAENDDDDGDLHYSHYDVLDLLDWEQDSLQGLLDYNTSTTGTSVESSCHPPDGISKSCCLGSFSTGGGVTDRFRQQCAAPFQQQQPQQQQGKHSSTLNGHERLQQATKRFFQKNRLPLKTTTRCDICRIVDLARHQNLTIALMGDSMHSQISDGLLCELQRRNYRVNSTYVDHNPTRAKDFVFRRHSLSQVLTITSPTWHSRQVVTIQYHRMYLLPLIDNAVLEITATADVVVLGFGLHWWYDNTTGLIFKRQSSYVSAMTELFQNITKQGRVKLLVHRETSAQHFDADGGEFSTWWHHPNRTTQLAQTCQAFANTDQSAGWRETAIQQAAQQSGHALVVAGPDMPELSQQHSRIRRRLAASHRNNTADVQPEVVVLPYFDFTSQLHSLHPVQDNFQDCTHYCSSPFAYYPLWRSLRFAMDRQFG